VPFKFEPRPQVRKLLSDENTALLDLLKKQPHEFDDSPRAIAYKVLTDHIYQQLTKDPEGNSYPIEGHDKQYRRVDTWGWRLIIEIDSENNVVDAFYLTRIKQPIPSIGQTLEEMGNYYCSKDDL
jgi:mRNA-degrading endonuclease RelE of RelBE toxin-antitoxin system